MVNEMLCHDLAGLKGPSLFGKHCRLVNQGNPTKAFKAMVVEAFNMTPSSIFTCSQAHLEPAGLCNKGDVVWVHKNDGNLQCCHVWMHAEKMA